jgi:type IV secretion system protein VirD4
MYKLSRPVLILAVALFAYCVVLGVVRAMFLIPSEKRGLAWVILATGVVALMARRKRRRFLNSGGTAAWAGLRKLARKKMLHATTGLVLGRVPCEGTAVGSAVRALLSPRLRAKDACGEFFDSLSRRKRRQGHLVRLPQAVHTSVYAPTGSGKGASLIVPFLKTCEDSCVVADGKNGELALLTAAVRRKMGHQIVLLDPTRAVTNTPDTLNLLDFIDRDSPHAVNEAAAVGNSLAIRTGQEKEPHFVDRTEAFLTALIGTTVWYGDKAKGTRSLLHVAELASNPAMLKAAMKLMQESPEVWNGSLARMGGMQRR